MEGTVAFQILAALFVGFIHTSNGQYHEISSLPPHLRNLAHCPAPGYYGDGLSCIRFYRCVDYGIPGSPMLLRHDFFCAPGTVYDSTLTVCNHPSRVLVSPGCQLKYAGGRVVPTIPPMQGLQGNSIDLETSNSPPGGVRNFRGYYYSEPEMLIQPRLNSFSNRRWPTKYIVAHKGPLVHVQVQVPYTVNS